MKNIFCIFLFLMTVATAFAQSYKEVVIKDVPFQMNPIKEYIFPEKMFPITKYGAKAGSKKLCTQAIKRAMEACSKAGGGYVVVPKGIWLTGAVHFQSNCNLKLEEGAVLEFTDNPNDYLPAVHTTWEGVECFNYSPLLYAYECENIAISGKGKLAPRMEFWRTWFSRPPSHIEATRKLYTWCSENVDMKERQLGDTLSRMRPHLIQFNRCKNVLLENFSIRESPFWTIHIYMCNGGIVRNLNVAAHGHNNDGIDIDMTKNLLVENCSFDQGDDGVVIKSGRNQDAWRLNCPTENIVIRNCVVHEGHTLLGIGSELSGGIRNIFLNNCKVDNHANRLLFIKTNHRRGGFVENIWMKNVSVKTCQDVFALATDVIYQWKDFPDYETRITKINGLHVENIEVDSCIQACNLQGDERMPVKNVTIRNMKIKYAKKLATFKNIDSIDIE